MVLSLKVKENGIKSLILLNFLINESEFLELLRNYDRKELSFEEAN